MDAQSGLLGLIAKRMEWLGHRQTLIAENVANADTPQYTPRDLKQAMLADLVWAYPQLEGVSGEIAWEGTMGYATHKMPQIGEIEPGVWTCQGFGGHGMNATTAGGEAVAKAIAGESDDYKLFEPFGWPYAGGPLGPVAAQSYYWWMQFKDWLSRPRRWSAE